MKKNLKLYARRAAKGLSQVEAAKKLDMPINVYTRIEHGETSGKIENWCKIQELYEVPDEEMWDLIKENRRY